MTHGCGLAIVVLLFAALTLCYANGPAGYGEQYILHAMLKTGINTNVSHFPTLINAYQARPWFVV